MKPRSTPTRHAFTLMELLAVLVVLALLALTLIPALARTQPNVRTAQCLNNLKQWGAAWQLFANANSDSLPRDGMGANGTYPGTGQDGTPNDQFAWFNLLPQLIGDTTLRSYFNSPGSPLARLPFPGERGRIWHCPSAYMTMADYAQVSGGGVNGFFSYAMNIDLKRQEDLSVFPYPSMPRITAFRKPAATVLFFDCVFNPRTEIINASPQFNSVNPANRYRSFGARHGNSGSISFLDGQARVFSSYYVTNGAGSFEPLRPDIIWNAPYRVANP